MNYKTNINYMLNTLYGIGKEEYDVKQFCRICSDLIFSYNICQDKIVSELNFISIEIILMDILEKKNIPWKTESVWKCLKKLSNEYVILENTNKKIYSNNNIMLKIISNVINIIDTILLEHYDIMIDSWILESDNPWDEPFTEFLYSED